MRQHIYPDHLYGETPRLAMPHDNPAASDLARLMVKLGVDGRSPRTVEASESERESRESYRLSMLRAVAVAGFAVDVRLDKSDRTDGVRAYYTYNARLREVGLLVADRPPGSQGRTLDMHWAAAGGVYTLRPSGTTSPDLDNYADEYDALVSRVVEAGPDTALEVVYARLGTYH